MEKAKKKKPTAWGIISTVLVVIIVVLAVALVGVRLFGIQTYTVLSGSMEPTYHTGSLIYVVKVDYKDLKVGDPITFMLDEDTIATHRIVEVIPDPEDPEVIRYRTKGDANKVEDGGTVHYKNIIGKPVFTIPGLGYIANFVQKPPGMYFAIAAGVLLIVLIFLPDLLAKGDKKNKSGDGGESGEKESSDRTDRNMF